MGIQLATGGASIDELIGAARNYEAAGAESVWIGDHLIDHYDPARPVPECFSVLATLAAHTSSIRFGSLVASCIARPVGLIAQIAGTLDEASGGRFELGIGVGGTRQEFISLGVPWPNRERRIDNYRNALRALTKLRTGGPVSDADVGISDGYCCPAPDSMRLVAAALGPRTATIAGTWADEVNVIDYADGVDAAAIIERARGTARDLGRSITASVLVPARSETEILGGRHPEAGLARAKAIGAQRLIYRLLPPFPDPDTSLGGEA